MGQVQGACKTIQFGRSSRMINPTSSDLTFDFSLGQESICFNCTYKNSCKLSGLLNVPVKSCRFYREECLSAVN